jgi:tripartite-type tricarboxylate transporter receptor subunit TctC
LSGPGAEIGLVPRSILRDLNREIVKALQLPEVKERIGKLGGEPVSLTPSELDAHLQQGIETNTVIVRAAGLKAN